MSSAKPSLTDFLSKKPGATVPPAPSSEGTPTASSPATKQMNGSGGGFFVPASEVDQDWELGKHLVRITTAEDYTSDKGKKSFKLRLVCLWGPTGKGAGISDWWPKEGAGLKKTHRGCKAVGLVDEENNIAVPGGAEQFVGRDLWIEILTVNEKRRNEDGDEIAITANKIGFLSYWPANAFEVPNEKDPFAEGEPMVTARTDQGEVIGVEAGAEE